MLRLILPAFGCASKAQKPTRFARNVSYTWGVVRPLSVQFRPSWHIYICDGPRLVPFSSTLMVSLQLVLVCLPSSSLCYRGRESLGSFQATAFALGPLRRPRNAAFQITLSRPWAGGPVMHINSMLGPQWKQFWKFLGGGFSNRYLIKRGSVHVQAPSGLAVRGWGVSQPRAPSPSLSATARRSLRLGVGAHGWVALLCQSWGHYFNLGAGCQ